jgi:hypothetical protein
VVQLDPTAEDKRQAPEALLGLTTGEANKGRLEALMARMVKLDLTVRDISWRVQCPRRERQPYKEAILPVAWEQMEVLSCSVYSSGSLSCWWLSAPP